MQDGRCISFPLGCFPLLVIAILQEEYLELPEALTITNRGRYQPDVDHGKMSTEVRRPRGNDVTVDRCFSDTLRLFELPDGT